MGSVETWSTKEEVLKDLARASGRMIMKKEDLDEAYIVIGDGPPPIIVEDEDDEMQLLFGEAACGKYLATTEGAKPDLLGIQQMLRMVNDYDGNEDDIRTNEASKSFDCVVITKVSHLNPYVKEFIPKGTSPSQSTVDSKNSSDSINVNIVTQTGDVEESSKKHIDANCNNLKIEVGLNNTKSNEYQDIATKLKYEISHAAKFDSFEFKKQKNIAIAKLLRAYANNNKLPTECTEPLKLITPEYFEEKKDDGLDVNIKNVNTALQTVSSASTSSTPKPINSSTTLPTCSSNSIRSTPLQTSSENNSQDSNMKTALKIKLDPEIKRSIEKVNKWLEEPAKRKSFAVCLAPVSFKKKEPNCHSNKSTLNDCNQKILKPSTDGQKYQPSNYAADLARLYMERNKTKEQQNKDVTWTNLYHILKEKDLLMKKRLEGGTSSGERN